MFPLILSSTSCSSSHRQTTWVRDRSSGGCMLLLRSGRCQLSKHRGASAGPSRGARCAGDGGAWLRGAALAHDHGARRAAAVPGRDARVKARGGGGAWPRGAALAGPRHAQGGGSAWSRGAVLVGLRHPLVSAARAGQQRRPAAMLGSRRGAATAPGRGAQSSQGRGARPRARRTRLGAGGVRVPRGSAQGTQDGSRTRGAWCRGMRVPRVRVLGGRAMAGRSTPRRAQPSLGQTGAKSQLGIKIRGKIAWAFMSFVQSLTPLGVDDGAGANRCFVNGTVGVNSQSQKKIGAKSQFRYKTRVQTQEPLINLPW